jgi:Fungal specific transcription factor domain
MMFEDLDATEFNPMKDVWFPLDLSNASSFNCIMAHSAAHLAHLYAGTSPRRGTKSTDALKYKAEAVRILHSWVADPKMGLSDEAFAAVIRLLTFEVSISET